MDNVDKGQVTSSAAEIYESFFIPAVFDQWPDKAADAANVQAGQHVLDVACGTGILARTLVKRVGTSGSVTGLDINAGMLSVARKKNSQIQWREGRAEDLPYDDNTFDAVVCQFGLMFFEDRHAAISEMIRVLKQGGYLAIVVWDSLEHTPGYSAMEKLLLELFGEKAANGLRAPFNLGDVKELRSLFDNDQIEHIDLTTHQGTARFESLEKWMFTEIKGWVLADTISDEQFSHLLDEAAQKLEKFVNDDGTVTFSNPAHILSARKIQS